MEVQHLVSSIEAQRAAEAVVINSPNVLDEIRHWLKIQKPIDEEITQTERQNFTNTGTRIGWTYDSTFKNADADAFKKPLMVMIRNISTDPAYVANCHLSTPALNLISSLNRLTVQKENAVMAYKVLDYAVNLGGLTDTAKLTALANDIYSIRELDLNYSFELLKAISVEGVRLNPAFRTLVPEVTNWLTKQEEHRVFTQSLQGSNSTQEYSRQEQIVCGQLSGAISRGRIREIICQQKGLDPNDPNNTITLDQKVQQQIIHIETVLFGPLHSLLNAGSEEERTKRMGDFIKSMDYFVSGAASGVLDVATQARVLTQVGEMVDKKVEYQKQLARYDAESSQQLLQEMIRAGVQFSERSRALCLAISSAEAFEHFIARDQVYGSKYTHGGAFKWEEFMEDVGEMCNEVLEVLDNHPYSTFDHAINQMYQGHFYEILIIRLGKLGTDLTGRAIGSENVEVKEITPINREYNKSGDMEGGTIKLFQDTLREQPLSKAIGNYLKNVMSDKYEEAEFLHNVDVISRKGMGWEQLKQYSAMLNLGGIDRLFHDDKELALAYQYYLRAIQEDLGLGLHVTGNDYGFTDMSSQLDFAQKRTLMQLKAHYGQHITGEESEVKRQLNTLEKRLKRKLRQATAISKGVTTEYWGTLLSARTPLVCESEIGPDGKTRYKTKTTFVSHHDSGPEKTLGELDPDLNMQRFLVPNHMYVAARYAFIPRDLSKIPDAWSKEGMFMQGHENVYLVRDWIEDALWDGRSKELEEFDKHFEVVSESMKEKGIDSLVRQGWRYLYHEVYTMMKPGTKELDFKRCVGALERLGPYGIKVFVDGLDFSLLGADAVREMIRVDKTGGQLSGQEKDDFKKACYEKLMFKPMFEAKPSKFLTLETRRFSPKEEFVVEHMNRFLRGKFVKTGTQQQYDYPRGLVDGQFASLFASALGMAERITWENRKEQGASLRYVFDQTHLQAMRNQVIDYYREYRAEFAKIQYRQGDSVKQIDFMKDVSEDQFMQMMGEYLQNLRGALTEERWAETADYETVATARGRRQPLSQDLLSRRQTLAQRYAKMLFEKRGNLAYLVAGDDFDLNQFYMSNGGRRVTERVFNEVHGGVVEVNKNFSNLMGEGIPNFVLGEYKEDKEMKGALAKHVVEPIAKAHAAYAGTIGKEPGPADEYAIRLTMYVAKIIGVDRPYRIAGLGWVLGWIDKNMTKSQLSLAQEFFRDVARRATTSLNPHGLEDLGKMVGNACKISWDARRRIGTKIVEVKDIFGRKVKKAVPVFDELPMHMGLFRKAEGLDLKSQVIEQSTMPPFILFLILLALLRLAMKKNSGKNH